MSKISKLMFYDFKVQIPAIALVGTLSLTAIGLSSCNKKETYNQEIVAAIHQENEKESQILKYIDISEKLSKLNLDKYILEEKEQSQIPLASVEEISNHIETFKENSNNLTILEYLKTQEKLVNNYIYEEGYNTSYKEALNAVKKYIAEMYGIENFEDIRIQYNRATNSDPEDSLFMVYNKDHKFLKGKVKNKLAIKGAEAVANVQVKNDANLEDNFSYSKERNDKIKKAIIITEMLNQEVESKDLYDSDLIKKLK